MLEKAAYPSDPLSGPSAGVRTRSGVCPECGCEFEPQRHWHQFCSDACRAKNWKSRQASLAFAPWYPPGQDAPAGWTPAQRQLSAHLDKRESRKARMLARLECGPATTLDLMQIGGAGFSSRLAELRRDGHPITCENHLDYAVYRLGVYR